MLKLINYQDSKTVGEITYETLNQPVDPKLQKRTFRAREKSTYLLFKFIIMVYSATFIIQILMISSRDYSKVELVLQILLIGTYFYVYLALQYLMSKKHNYAFEKNKLNMRLQFWLGIAALLLCSVDLLERNMNL